MSRQDHRRGFIRAGIYLIALVVVLLLMQYRSALISTQQLKIVEMREVEGSGPIRPGRGEKLIAITVQLVTDAVVPRDLRPELFSLVDDQAREHRPEPLSPFFADRSPQVRDDGVKGILIFRLDRGAEGKSLSFHPEVAEHAPNHQPENSGSKGGS